MSGTTNFRNAFPGGVTLRGVQAFVSSALGKVAGGKVFFVSSVTGSDGNAGTDTTKPFATLAKAVSLCRANKGDVIYLMAKHAETVASAAAIDINKGGITIIGLGEGADRPTFTFSATASTITVTAASVTVRNIITKPSIDSVVSPIVVSAADVTLDYEHQDASATVESVRAILTTAAADRLNVRLKYLGFIAGDACVNAVRLVGGNDVTVDVDFYGKASTSIVEFHTTACSNVTVNGYAYNSGTLDGTKNIIDTVTGSAWFAVIDDGAAGTRYTGGSASALASASATSATGIGSEFWVKKTLTSSAITQAGVDITGVSTTGELAIEDVIVKTDATGLAAGTNFTISSNNVKGLANVFAETVANLGANKTIDLTGASVTKIRTVLETGKKLTAKSTVADCTGAGTIDIYIKLQRLTAAATIAAA